jgi:hypothetical protein
MKITVKPAEPVVEEDEDGTWVTINGVKLFIFTKATD